MSANLKSNTEKKDHFFNLIVEILILDEPSKNMQKTTKKYKKKLLKIVDTQKNLSEIPWKAQKSKFEQTNKAIGRA